MNRSASIAVLCALCAAVYCVGTAHAGDDSTADSAVEKARANFQQGVELFHEGSFDAAIVEFRKAYRLAPSFRILFNIGQAYYELHDYVNALRSFQQYLSDGKVDVPPARRAEVEALIQKLETRVAQLEIQTNVRGAEIFVDDVSAGLSPLPFTISVNAGHRRVSVVKDGYMTANRQIDVSVGEQLKISVELSPTLTSSPENNATVRPTPLATKGGPPAPSSNAFAFSVVATGTCAIGATVFGLLALGAKRDFERQLATYPTSADRIDTARASMLTYAIITDVFATATLVGAGLSTYYFLAKPDPRPARAVKRQPVVVPTLGGLLVKGAW